MIRQTRPSDSKEPLGLGQVGQVTNHFSDIQRIRLYTFLAICDREGLAGAMTRLNHAYCSAHGVNLLGQLLRGLSIKVGIPFI
jgi:hypothetical protein